MTNGISRRSFLVGAATTTGLASHSLRAATKPNVLLIICDDLNDTIEGLGGRGHVQAASPNIRKLESAAVTFTNAQANAPLCNPSRASIWSGLYPHTTGFYGYEQHKNHWRNNPTLRRVRTLFEHFHQNGYSVFGTGKVFHGNNAAEFHRLDPEAFGISESHGPFAYNGRNTVAHPSLKKPYGSWAMCSFAPLSDVPNVSPDPATGAPGYRGWWDKGKAFRYVSEADRDKLVDEQSADWVVDLLRRKHDKPFFIATGFMRPHRPMVAPKKYFDQFPLEKIELPAYLKNDLEDCPRVLWQGIRDDERRKGFVEFQQLMRAYPDGEGWKRWVQAYLACVAFVDDQAGKVLRALEASPYADNTIVVFTSDNGYHMGEKDYMFKETVWEESTRVPIIVRAPGLSQAGGRCDHPVSLVDLYPSLLDLCGLPGNPHRDGGGPPLDGHSLRPFLANPRGGTWNGPDVALSVVYGEDELPIDQPGVVSRQHFTVRSKQYRYTLCNTGEEELYDHSADPREWHNMAGNARFAGIKSDLKKQLLELIRKPGR